MSAWTYFDADGAPLPSSENAAFKGKEIRGDTDVSAASVFGAPADSAYHEVHAIDEPGLRKTFASSALLKAWCKEQVAKPKSARR